MKIAFVCPEDLSVMNFTRSLVVYLKRAAPEHQIFVISSFERGFRTEIEALGVIAIDVPLNRFISPVGDLQYLSRLYRIFRRERFDVAVNWGHKPNVYGAVVERLTGVHNITSAVRGLGAPFSASPTPRNVALRGLLTAFYAAAFRLCTKVWFTNREDAAYFIEQGLLEREKTVVTKNAIDVQLFRRETVSPELAARARRDFGFAPDDIVILMVGRLLWSKGVREFVEAAERLSESYPKARFVLAGGSETGSPDAVPESYLASRMRTPYFRWTGFVKDLRTLYSITSVAVLPSYFREGGYPRALLEPMAFGIPVIAADTPHCGGVVEDGRTGYLVPPRDVNALVAAIERLLSSPARRAAFGARTRAKIEAEFDDRRVAKEILSHIGILSDPDAGSFAAERG
jgi:N,N'-diacetylbacillosaminyl-diphospho-undecaprenol alpha-1,3-N-acetylgalactosaminyltransferase